MAEVVNVKASALIFVQSSNIHAQSNK